MTKRLITLISTKGKAPKQGSEEMMKNVRHYEKVHAKALKDLQTKALKTKNTHGNIIDLRPKHFGKD